MRLDLEPRGYADTTFVNISNFRQQNWLLTCFPTAERGNPVHSIASRSMKTGSLRLQCSLVCTGPKITWLNLFISLFFCFQSSLCWSSFHPMFVSLHFASLSLKKLKKKWRLKGEQFPTVPAWKAQEKQQFTRCVFQTQPSHGNKLRETTHYTPTEASNGWNEEMELQR